MKKIIKEMIPYILIIGVVLLVKQYVVSPVRVNGSSMDSTLQDKDIMILNKVVYRFQEVKRFDIVVIKTENDPIIKRVIGLPGEKIEYKNNILYVNGKKVEENFSHKETEDFNIEKLGSKIVPEGSYFVLGDNRGNSVDSRYLGFIKKENILGRTKYTILPPNRLGKRK